MARKILLADDSVTAQNMGRKILADAGYEVITVNNGSAALKKIAEHKPDVIVLDVYMPGYSGLEVCQRIKEAQETSRLPVLLTVGKLEPFKPEEAKRVRADGFIVKPFEASELLSALSKLEDKIVPRAEAKPGRFARANAALDEGKYDKTVAVGEDSGWKNRIGFPTKKKEEAAPEDADNSSFYNPMNKDLRTQVERKPEKSQPSDQSHESKVEEPRVDLGALAPEGLPKDVTPEEIAALAAAAAQVKGKIAEVKIEEGKIGEGKLDEVKAAPPVEEKIEAKIEREQPEAASAAASIPASSSSDGPKSDSPGPISPSPADVMAAIAGLEADAATSAAANSGNGSWSRRAAEPTSEHNPEHISQHSADEPVTMAVGAAADSVATTSRWTAVAVTLAPEEAVISLELEMQKAYAAFAAAETSHAGAHAAVAELRPAISEPELSKPELSKPDLVTSDVVKPALVEAAAAETVSVAAPATVESVATAVAAPEPVVTVAAAPPSAWQSAPAAEVAETLSAIANTAADAVGDAVKEHEAVAAELGPVPVDADLMGKAAPVVEAAQAVASPTVDASIADAPAATATEATPETPKLEAAKPDAPEVKHQEVGSEEPRDETPLPAKATALVAHAIETMAPAVADAVSERMSAEVAANPMAANPSSAESIPVNQFSADQVSVRRVSGSVVPGSVSDFAVVAAGHPATGGTDDMAKKESEAAAAWASFRRIRETGDPKASAEPATQEDESAPQDLAAMAVAAGAEKAPEEMSSAADSKTADIASIVDSVLADLRPKIVEEISRQMGRKK